MQCRPNMHRGPCVLIKQHILPRYQHVVEDQERINLVESIRQRIIGGRSPPGKSSSADNLETWSRHIADEAYCISGEFGVSPIRNRGFHKGLIRVGGRCLILRTAHDDAGISLIDDM